MECAGPATVVFDPSLTEYDFGPAHPMSPIRVDLTMRLAAELGVTGQGSAGRLRLVDAPFATLDQIATVHDARLIEAVESSGRTNRPEELLGLGTDDNPVFLVRCAVRSTTGILASVDYTPHGTLLYNLGAALPVEFQNNRSQQFTIVVDFLAGTTSLSIDGAPEWRTALTMASRPMR